MVWCKYCAKSVHGTRPDDSVLCCELCGRVLETANFSHEPTFVKNSSGQSQLSGNYVRTIQSDDSLSRERTLQRAHDDMIYMWVGLSQEQEVFIVDQAVRFYRIALERNFTRGRRTEQVQAACLYIACRHNNRPYLLIEFSHYLQINVYVLGAVFLQLRRMLSLEEHPIFKLVDPSIFMHKFIAGLIGKKDAAVFSTACFFIASMKREWIQTGRKPNGVCGLALYLSARCHGYKCSISDVKRIVHISDATLTKRLLEFESTESASLTIEELENVEKEYRECGPTLPSSIAEDSGTEELLCEHKGGNQRPYALRLCKTCYGEFCELSGGLQGGADPPAFQRAERERMEKAAAKENDNQSSVEKELDSINQCETETLRREEPDSSGAAAEQMAVNEDDGAKESETLSDIDDEDLEVDSYLYNEEEKHYRKIIWEKMNWEYLQEQAAKEEAAAAAREANQNCSEDVLAARELASAAAEAVGRSRKERQQKRAAEAKSMGPAQTAAEATRQMLTKKRLLTKIDQDKLDELFKEPELAAPPTDSIKRSKTEPISDDVTAKKPDENGKFEVENDYEDEYAEEGNDDIGETYDFELDDYGYDDY